MTHDQEEALSISDRVAVLSHGQIEQIGSPGEIYGAPATPFVAEFVGTMNRIESTVADPESGRVEYDRTPLSVDAARGRPRGERVLLLVRPETVELEAVAGSAENGLVGEVVSQTFLGSVTRLRVLAGPTEWTADLSADRAAALPVGARVSVRFPAASAKLLSLEGFRCRAAGAGARAGELTTSRRSAGRSLKIPSTPSATSRRIRRSSLTV